MRDAVIILLVNAATTIIVTVVTVRFTMTGRVVSQSTKAKLKTKAIPYIFLMLSAIFTFLSVRRLSEMVHLEQSLDRVAVFQIAMYTWWSGFWLTFGTFWLSRIAVEWWEASRASKISN